MSDDASDKEKIAQSNEHLLYVLHEVVAQQVQLHCQEHKKEVEDWRRIAGELAADCIGYRGTLDLLANDGTNVAPSLAEYEYGMKIQKEKEARGE